MEEKKKPIITPKDLNSAFTRGPYNPDIPQEENISYGGGFQTLVDRNFEEDIAGLSSGEKKRLR